MNRSGKAVRRWRNHFVKPLVQIRFGLHILALALAYCLLIGAIIWISYREQYAQFIAFYQGVDGDSFFRELMLGRYLFGLVGIFLLFVLSMFLVVVIRTHKIYGPMVSIRRFVDGICKGDCAKQISIREGDDFQELAADLNRLSASLQRRGFDASAMTRENKGER